MGLIAAVTRYRFYNLFCPVLLGVVEPLAGTSNFFLLSSSACDTEDNCTHAYVSPGKEARQIREINPLFLYLTLAVI